MITSAHNKAITELMNIYAAWHFEVPRYQREYVWKRDQWEQLFDDLWTNDPGYFLGWLSMLQNLTDSPVIQERFLRQHYNAFKHDRKIAVPKITRATRSNIIRIYDNLATRNATDLLDNLVDRSRLYGQLIAPSRPVTKRARKKNFGICGSGMRKAIMSGRLNISSRKARTSLIVG